MEKRRGRNETNRDCSVCSRSGLAGGGAAGRRSEGSQAEEARPIPIDDRYRQLAADRAVVAALIEMTEQARGDVKLRFSTADLRKLDEKKVAAILA